jgi:hypothetical protein
MSRIFNGLWNVISRMVGAIHELINATLQFATQSWRFDLAYHPAQ